MLMLPEYISCRDTCKDLQDVAPLTPIAIIVSCSDDFLQINTAYNNAAINIQYLLVIGYTVHM